MRYTKETEVKNDAASSTDGSNLSGNTPCNTKRGWGERNPHPPTKLTSRTEVE